MSYLLSDHYEIVELTFLSLRDSTSEGYLLSGHYEIVELPTRWSLRDRGAFPTVGTKSSQRGIESLRGATIVAPSPYEATKSFQAHNH